MAFSLQDDRGLILLSGKDSLCTFFGQWKRPVVLKDNDEME